MYDHVIGRVLAPDNFVGDASNAQDFNRYSYARNNPLKYVDEDGEWVHLVVGAVIGGITKCMINGNKIHKFGQGLKYFGIGALAGAVSAGVGVGIQCASAGASFAAGFVGSPGGISAITSLAQGGFWWGAAATGAAAGASGLILGSGNAWMGGANFGNGLWTGVKQGLISGVAAGLVGGTLSGLNATLDGRDFWTGKMPYKDVSLKIPFVFQETGSRDCLLANSEMLEKYYGGTRNIEDFRTILDGLPEGATISDYYNAAGFEIVGKPENAMHVIRTMEVNKFPTTITTLEGYNTNGLPEFHNATITRVRMWTPTSKAIFWVNDPVRGANYRWTQDKLYRVLWDRLTIGGLK
jgi:hypothetical protein